MTDTNQTPLDVVCDNRKRNKQLKRELERMAGAPLSEARSDMYHHMFDCIYRGVVCDNTVRSAAILAKQFDVENVVCDDCFKKLCACNNDEHRVLDTYAENI